MYVITRVIITYHLLLKYDRLTSTDPSYELFIELMLPQNCSTSLHWFAWLFWSGYASLIFQNHFTYLKYMEKSKDIWKQHLLDAEKTEGRPLFLSEVIITWKEPAADYSVWVMTSVAAMNHVPYQLYTRYQYAFIGFASLLGWSGHHVVFQALRRWFRNLITWTWDKSCTRTHAQTVSELTCHLFMTRIIWFWNLFSLRYVETQNACINLLMHFITLCCIPWFVRSLLTMKAGGISSISRIIRRASPHRPTWIWIRCFFCSFSIVCLMYDLCDFQFS